MNTQPLFESLLAWLPELILSFGGMAVILLGVFTPPTSARGGGAVLAAAWITLLASAAALAMAPVSGPAFFDLIVLDQTSLLFRWLALGVVALVALMVASSKDVDEAWTGEYVGILLLIGVGLMLMAEANHLLIAYLALELVSLSSYVLVGLARDARSSEAALKYLLFGALSSGIMLFGFSLVYGLTGELSLPGILEAVERFGAPQTGALVISLSLILAGLAFKISMAPFHMWTPDVYEGAPIPVTAMLSVGPKAAGFALLLRITEVVRPIWSSVEPLLLVLTVVTMTLGNLVALAQTNVKRLLAYSTIGQVGYLLIGFTVNTTLGLEALFAYLVAYLFMNLGAFACVVAVCSDAKSESLDAFRGLGRRAPALAFCLALFLLSLAGIPPMLGFIGKFLLFGSAVQADRLVLALIAAVNSAIALYYYVNIIRLMYLAAPERPAPLAPALGLRVAVGVCSAATLGLGLFPGRLLTWLRTLI